MKEWIITYQPQGQRTRKYSEAIPWLHDPLCLLQKGFSQAVNLRPILCPGTGMASLSRWGNKFRDTKSLGHREYVLVTLLSALSQIRNGMEREIKSKLQTAEESPLNTQLLSFLNNKYIEMITLPVSTEELPHIIFQSGFVHIASFGLTISLIGGFPISECQVMGWGEVVFEWEHPPWSQAFEYSISSGEVVLGSVLFWEEVCHWRWTLKV